MTFFIKGNSDDYNYTTFLNFCDKRRTTVLFLFVTLFCFCSCKPHPAQIVNRSHIVYSKKNTIDTRSSRSSGRYESGSVKAAQKITVGSGDTLLGIAKDYEVTLRDLIVRNNLKPPYDLRIGQVLIIPTPNYYEVKAGDSLYAISRRYGMKLDDLVKMNGLEAPYGVRVGQRIRISEIKDNLKYSSKSVSRNSSSKEEKKIYGKSGDFSWPIKGKIISSFGPKTGGLYNDGINIAAPKGAAVNSSASGVVAYVGNELKGYGNLVIVKHSNGWITAYAHLQKTYVKRGQKVSVGEKIATVGATGNVKSPQLYFGLRKGRDAVDPKRYLK